MSKEKEKKAKKGSWKQANKLYSFIEPYKWVFVAGLIFLALTGATAIVFPKIMGSMVDAVKGESGYSINQVGLALLVVIFLQSIFSFFRIYLFGIVSEKGLATLREKAFSHLIQLPKSFFDQRRVGELNSRISNDISLIQDSFTTSIAEFIRQLIVIVGSCIMLFTVSVKLTLFMLAIVPLIAVFAVFFGRYIKQFSKQTQDQLAKSNVVVDEALQSISIVKTFTNELFEITRYKNHLSEVVKFGLKGAMWRGAFASFIIFCIFGSIIAVVWYASHLVQGGSITTGQLFEFVLYTVFIGASIGGITAVYAQILKALGATEDVMAIFEEEAEPVSLTPTNTKTTAIGNINFEGVKFHYPSRPDINILKGVSINIKQGENVAIVGPSGSGKSTLAALLMRFYNPSEGNILLDNKKLSDWDLSELRSQIGIVPQETLLFGGTIKENIKYGNPNATDDQILDAAKIANAFEFIEKLPEKLETVVGERGIQLSGGQRQRIAIARAVIKDPRVLILDEATSSLDSESERLVQEALDRIMTGRTSLIIAHRFSTIKNADKIVVLENGEIEEFGSHEDLIANTDGLYKKLVDLQTLEA